MYLPVESRHGPGVDASGVVTFGAQGYELELAHVTGTRAHGLGPRRLCRCAVV